MLSDNDMDYISDGEEGADILQRKDPSTPKNRSDTLRSSKFARAPSYSPISDMDSGVGNESYLAVFDTSTNAYGLTPAGSSSPSTPAFDSLPTELIQDIMVRVNSDSDLSSVIKSSSALHSILSPDRSNDIWRQRFLAIFDHPYLDNTFEFPYAYKLRQYVLQKFDMIAVAHGLKEKSGHQLDVVKDLILETYNSCKPQKFAPKHSKNLAVFSSTHPPAWLVRLMSCPFYGSGKQKYGQPNLLFDTIQVCLSHVVLSPKSPILGMIPSSRDNYDLVKVYNYNRPFATLLEAVEDESIDTVQPFKSSRFPNLKSPSKSPEPTKLQYRLDIHGLLHIRNFWQRHFNDDMQGIGENTYTSMMRSLSALNIVPSGWSRSLHEYSALSQKWCGHYSSLNPWPKSRQDLEERQSCAEDWEFVDPMTLDIETSASNDDSTFWPAAFSSIPAFADLLPDSSLSQQLHITYIRGLAPFMDLKHCMMTGSRAGSLKWHPYLASRVSGFVHDVPDETLMDDDAQERRNDAYNDDSDRPIPGWKHVVMVVWKPTTRYLLAVLDHAEEEYGGVAGIQISADLNTANIWNNANADPSGSTVPTVSIDIDQPIITAIADDGEIHPVPSSTDNGSNDGNNNAQNTQPVEAQIEAQMKILLNQRIQSFTKNHNDLLATQAADSHRSSCSGLPSKSNYQPRQPDSSPPLFSPLHIHNLEDSFSSLQYISWDDGTIDYAYAYEGVLIPGGEIMLGRWWRLHGSEGLGAGREIGLDGIGVEVRTVPSDSTASSTDADVESGGKSKGKAKRKKCKKAGKRARRSVRCSGRKRKARVLEDESDGEDGEDEDGLVDGEEDTEYEFVTLVNGEESRAVNGCKGLERGPFVFWAM